MPATAEQLRIAAAIEKDMRQLLGAGCNDVEIMAAMYDHMYDHMADFKRLIDSQPGYDRLAELCERFPSFNRFAKVLENVAAALRDGRLADLGFGQPRSNDTTH